VLRKIGIGLVVMLASLLGAVAVTLIVSAPEGPPSGSASAMRLKPGPHEVGSADFTFIDRSRSTPGHNDFAGDSQRKLVSTIWYPVAAAGPHPFVVYSHGFMSFRSGGRYLAEHLASHGYVVVSADYPATNFYAPGGPNLADTVNQPADVSFLIDSVLSLSKDDRPFKGSIDSSRIGVMGLSLGGLTTTLVTFHPKLRDPRIKAAVSIAGPNAFFSEGFFRTVATPYLAIAATEDAMVDYASNAAIVPTRAPTGALLTIEGGSHTGFADIAEPLFRFVRHPDSVGCGALMENIRPTAGSNPFPGIGGEEVGIIMDPNGMLPCQKDPLPEAMHPGRQHMLTLLGVTAFLQSIFAHKKAERESAEQHLRVGLARDFPEASFKSYSRVSEDE